MGNFMYLVHKQYLECLLMCSQSLVWELLGGSISLRLQRGNLNGGGGLSLLSPSSKRKIWHVNEERTREAVQSAHFRFPLASTSMLEILLSQALVFLEPLFRGNKGSLTSVLWSILGFPSNAAWRKAHSQFTFQSLPHLPPGIISKE